MLLEEEVRRWKDYRKALRKMDQKLFDELMKHARTHSSASGYFVTTNPFETMVMAILLEIKKEIENLEKQ
jgi:predicted DNA-binding transcriptional regulator